MPMSDRPSRPAPPDRSNWHPWQMEELPQNPASHRARTGAGDRQLNLAELRDQTQRLAHDEGRRAGFEKGSKEGYTEGHVKGFEAGHREGLEKGLTEGRAMAEQELHKALREALEPLAPLTRQFDEALRQLRDEIAGELVELAFVTGGHLARDRIDARPELILNIVRDLLHIEPMLNGKPRLWLHPDDLSLVREHLGTEFDALGWSLQPDDLMSRGGCRATSASGEIDATWEGRWEAIMTRTRRRHRQDDQDSPEVDP